MFLLGEYFLGEKLVRQVPATSFVMPVFLALVFLVTFLTTGVACADVAVDIRVAGKLLLNADTIDYVATLSDCTNLTSIEIQGGEFQSTLLPNEASRIEALPLGCQVVFTATGSGRLNPQVTLSNRDGSVQVHTEAFATETNAPTLAFDTVGLQLIDGRQYLITRVLASDDTDLGYIGFTVTGLRASALRTAGGVVDKARETAFAATQGTVRVYPKKDGQSDFSLALPVSNTLNSDVV